MPQAYYRKWRPTNWDEVVGQEHVIHTLRNAVRRDQVVHAYLFAGPRGTGKTTTARILAKAVNCLAEDLKDRPCNKCQNCQEINAGRFLDLIEIDAASNTSVDDVRDLREKINYSPSKGRYKVYIIDEVHMLSNAAFNALLKTLEEPPAHTIFILATTEGYKIPATVLSRCQRHEFRRIPINFITAQLKCIADQEKLAVEPEAMILIARQATGSMRDAISLLDQLASMGEKITLELAQNVLGAATDESVYRLIDMLQTREAGEGVVIIHRALDSGADPRKYAYQVVNYLRAIMMSKLGNESIIEATQVAKKRIAVHARGFSMPLLLSDIRLFNRAATSSYSGWQPALQLELAITEAVSLEERELKKKEDDLHYIKPNLKASREHSSVNKKLDKKNSGADKVVTKKIITMGKDEKRSHEQKNFPKRVEQGKKSEDIEEGLNSQNKSMEKKTDLNLILDNWSDIRVLVKKQSPQTEALLNSCKIITMKHGTLILGFASDLLKSKMENSDNLTLTKSTVKSVVNLDVPIACSVVSNHATTISHDMDIDSDGMVGTALSLGGKIVKKDPNV